MTDARKKVPMNPLKKIIEKWNDRRYERLIREKTRERELLLNPNRDSEIKVENYEFPLSQAIVIGTAIELDALEACPQCAFKSTHLVCNAPSTNFVFIRDIRASNVGCSISESLSDAYFYHARANQPALCMPTLSQKNRVKIDAFYTGYIPPGYVAGTQTFFSATFFGYATLAGDWEEHDYETDVKMRVWERIYSRRQVVTATDT